MAPTNTLLVDKYLGQYPLPTRQQVQGLVDQNHLQVFLLKRHPQQHAIQNDQSLRDYVMDLKNRQMKKSSPLSKIIYDDKIHVIHNALGLHTYVSRVQGGKLKSKHELRVSALFKKASDAMLNMIVVHELAHLKEKEHNKAFYRLCTHMMPDYHQIEFETRLYLLLLDMKQSLYGK
jgi:predicted metal-dependent hydrolase